MTGIAVAVKPSMDAIVDIAVAPATKATIEVAVTPVTAEVAVDPRSGFCADTATFHSLRHPLNLPPQEQPCSVASFCFSHLLSTTSVNAAAPDFPERPAYVDAATGASVSYPAFAAQVRTLASALRDRGILSKGDVAFVMAPATINVPLLYMAIFSSGAVVCPSNPACTPYEIARQYRLVNPKVAFAASSTAHLLPTTIPDTDIAVPIIQLDSTEFQTMLVDDGPVLHPPHFQNGTAHHHQKNSVSVDIVEVKQSDPAVILFSSGTTGVAKAVLETHRNYIAMVAELADRRARGLLPVGDGPFLLGAPMFHSLGMLFSIKGIALGETTLVADRPGIPGLLKAANQYGIASMTAAPPFLVAMAKLPEEQLEAAGGLRQLRQVISGGAPLLPAFADMFRARFPWVDVMQGYGMTEGGGISMMITPQECLNYRSVGRLNSTLKARIVDPDTEKPLGVGISGELRLKGSSVMKEYVKDEKATKFTFDSEGWLRTGDLCYFDEEGYIYIVGRLKELIKYKGYQVPPAELEQLLMSNEEIAEAAVVPYPDELAGEIPMAFVVRQLGSTITEAQIMDFVGKQVAPYKKIRKVSFVNSIPRNSAGKIARKELVASWS